MLREEERLEFALDLHQAGVRMSSHDLLEVVFNMAILGYRRYNYSDTAAPVVHTTPDREHLFEPPPVLAEAAPEPVHHIPATTENGRVFTGIGREVVGRLPTDSGVAWGTEFVNPNNTESPANWQDRKRSGWSLNHAQKEIVQLFCGTTGRYTVSYAAVEKRIRTGSSGLRDPNRTHIKPHYPIHSLMRRGIIQELDKEVYILSPRGRMMCEHFNWNPVAKHVAIETVA